MFTRQASNNQNQKNNKAWHRGGGEGTVEPKPELKNRLRPITDHMTMNRIEGNLIFCALKSRLKSVITRSTSKNPLSWIYAVHPKIIYHGYTLVNYRHIYLCITILGY